MKIKDYILKYWEKKTLKKWEYLYKANEKDTNLYFILKWSILLKINWTNIALVWDNEISGEKSFIEWTEKPIDALAETEVEYLVISPDKFNDISSREKELFLKKLILFISNRVYLLNSIVQNVSSISLNITNNKNTDFGNIKGIFKWVFELENIYVYKFIWDSIISIYDSKFNLDTVEITKKYRTNDNLFYNLWWWQYIIKSGDFCFILEWKNISSEYIMNNVILNSIASFSYLWWLLEQQKEEDSMWFLD